MFAHGSERSVHTAKTGLETQALKSWWQGTYRKTRGEDIALMSASGTHVLQPGHPLPVRWLLRIHPAEPWGPCPWKHPPRHAAQVGSTNHTLLLHLARLTRSPMRRSLSVDSSFPSHVLLLSNERLIIHQTECSGLSSAASSVPILNNGTLIR